MGYRPAISYMAYKGLMLWDGDQKTSEELIHEQMSGFLKKYEENNPNSVIDMTMNYELEVTYVFCCPRLVLRTESILCKTNEMHVIERVTEEVHCTSSCFFQHHRIYI